MRQAATLTIAVTLLFSVLGTWFPQAKELSEEWFPIATLLSLGWLVIKD